MIDSRSSKRNANFCFRSHLDFHPAAHLGQTFWMPGECDGTAFSRTQSCRYGAVIRFFQASGEPNASALLRDGRNITKGHGKRNTPLADMHHPTIKTTWK